MDNYYRFCTNCGCELEEDSNFCSACGAPRFNGMFPAIPTDGTAVDASALSGAPVKQTVSFANYPAIFRCSEEVILDRFLEVEFLSSGLSAMTDMVPAPYKRRRIIMDSILALLVAGVVVLTFFHLSAPLNAFLGVLLLVWILVTNKRFKLKKYVKKEVAQRPGEKISNIVMTVKNSMVPYRRWTRAIVFTAALILPMFFFITPRAVYEKSETGYGYVLRFYTLSLTDNEYVVIPDTYMGEPVVGIRGNVFASMRSLKGVELPDTVTELRGQAFMNDTNLVNVKLPANLEYLGGSAFKGCYSLEEIYLPETLTYMGGECFSGCNSLKKVNIPEGLTEIRGETFNECDLRSIVIPDSIERIGGHAFYGNANLSEVVISENSRLTEIGSSAFRMCLSLYTINLPQGVEVNDRAFKESPTEIIYY